MNHIGRPTGEVYPDVTVDEKIVLDIVIGRIDPDPTEFMVWR